MKLLHEVPYHWHCDLRTDIKNNTNGIDNLKPISMERLRKLTKEIYNIVE